MNPKYKNGEVGTGVVLDVNSLYPSVMHDKPMPYGYGKYYTGNFDGDKIYDLYIQRIVCSFELKENKIPTIQIKKSMSFIPTEYLSSSGGEVVTLILTSVDLKLFFEQYNVYNLQYIDGFKFKSITGLFTKYIDKWTERKIQAGKEGNKGQRQLAKLMLNGLYGKFATSQEAVSKIPILREEGSIEYIIGDKEEKKGLYIPIGSFITAYAREKTIRTSQAIKDYSIEKYGIDMYCYSDTDSIHTILPEEDLKLFVDIDDYELGKWKLESKFEKAKFIRQKTYLEMFDEVMNITCAGMPSNVYNQVTWENFKEGLRVEGKLVFKHVKGGAKLVETDFTIKTF